MPNSSNGDGRRNNRPPISGQFKPGQSGHSAGRPKGTRNRRKVLDDELNRIVTVKENGKPIRKRKWDIIVAQQVNKAVNGDNRAVQYVTEQMIRHGLLTGDEADLISTKIDPNEEAVLVNLAMRIRESVPAEQQLKLVKTEAPSPDALRNEEYQK